MLRQGELQHDEQPVAYGAALGSAPGSFTESVGTGATEAALRLARNTSLAIDRASLQGRI